MRSAAGSGHRGIWEASAEARRGRFYEGYMIAGGLVGREVGDRPGGQDRDGRGFGGEVEIGDRDDDHRRIVLRRIFMGVNDAVVRVRGVWRRHGSVVVVRRLQVNP